MEKLNNRYQNALSRCKGFVDHNPYSKTKGCADRNFWHYQDGKGFAVGSFQVMMLGMMGGQEYFSEKTNSFFNTGKLCLEWWADEIIKKPCLDEYFLNQNSFCATAYTAMSASLVINFLSSNEKHLDHYKLALTQTFKFLKNDSNRPDSANQTLAAMLAFDVAGVSENPFELKIVENEGFYSEYGGFDLGYSLKCIDMCVLALSTFTDTEKIEKYNKILINLLRMVHKVVVGYTFNPSLGSRGNPHKLIGGLSVLESRGVQIAKEILERIKSPIAFGRMVSADQCDDKYMSFFHLTSLMLEQHALSGNSKLLPLVEKFDCASDFTDMKYDKLESSESFVFYQQGDLKIALSLYSSGAVHLENNNSVYTCLGYLFRDQNELYGPGGAIQKIDLHETEKGEIIIEYDFMAKKSSERSLQIQSNIFGLFFKLMMSLPIARSILRNYIYNQTYSLKSEIKVGRRTIRIQKDGVSIKDKFYRKGVYSFLHNWSMVDGHSTRMIGDDSLFVGDELIVENEKEVILVKEFSGNDFYEA
ncbi:MAG: hypothetical protein COA79_17210 [Planctomycetota bacterium]|nr:MAG: hypothetical protein COA79_17210 [Planctomycetota bacterium]